jgi:two-component system nitrogen regulation response regulator GlnG
VNTVVASEDIETRPSDNARAALLLVDDDPLISETLSFVLADQFDVRCADTGVTALSSLRGGGSMPDLALVDLGLPPAPHSPEGGFALIEELLALNPAMKVLVLSGQSELPTLSPSRAIPLCSSRAWRTS